MKKKVGIALYVYLFFKQFIKNLSIVLTVFLKKKQLKYSKKSAFSIKCKAEVLGELNVKT